MPYVITTLVPLDPPEAGHDVSRRAVATLEDAREPVAQLLGANEDLRGEIWEVLCHGVAGPTTMPLSGGTVIEVEPVTTMHLLHALGRKALDPMDAEQIIAAYNTAQVV